MRTYTQKEIYDYLKANPLGVDVNIGDLEDLNGKDYIFLDYLNDVIIPYDNECCYETNLQISIVTKELETRKALVKYIKDKFIAPCTYSKQLEFGYYQAQMTIGVFISD